MESSASSRQHDAVVLTGLSEDGLNGQRADINRFDDLKGRFGLKLGDKSLGGVKLANPTAYGKKKKCRTIIQIGWACWLHFVARR